MTRVCDYIIEKKILKDCKEKKKNQKISILCAFLVRVGDKMVKIMTLE